MSLCCFLLYLRDDKSYVSDATAAILVVFSMFLFPSVRPEMFGGKRATGKRRFPNLLTCEQNEQAPFGKVLVSLDIPAIIRTSKVCNFKSFSKLGHSVLKL